VGPEFAPKGFHRAAFSGGGHAAQIHSASASVRFCLPATLASWFALSGASEQVIALIGGWLTPAMVKKYARLRTEDVRQYANAVGTNAGAAIAAMSVPREHSLAIPFATPRAVHPAAQSLTSHYVPLIQDGWPSRPASLFACIIFRLRAAELRSWTCSALRNTSSTSLTRQTPPANSNRASPLSMAA
jgi:hypothetical protein